METSDDQPDMEFPIMEFPIVGNVVSQTKIRPGLYQIELCTYVSHPNTQKWGGKIGNLFFDRPIIGGNGKQTGFMLMVFLTVVRPLPQRTHILRCALLQIGEVEMIEEGGT